MIPDPNHLGPIEHEAYERAVADFEAAVAREPYRLMVIPPVDSLTAAQDALQRAANEYLADLPAQDMEEALNPSVQRLFGHLGEARVGRVVERPDGVLDIQVVVSMHTPAEHITINIDTEGER